MKNIIVDLKIKFRAFGMTYYNLDRHWKFPIDIPVAQEILVFQDRGVYLHIFIQ